MHKDPEGTLEQLATENGIEADMLKTIMGSYKEKKKAIFTNYEFKIDDDRPFADFHADDLIQEYEEEIKSLTLNSNKAYICTYDGGYACSPYAMFFNGEIYSDKKLEAMYREYVKDADEYVWDYENFWIVIANIIGANEFYDLSLYC